MKIAIIGDVHFGRKAENPTIKTNVSQGQLDFFNWLVPELKKNGIDTIYFTGDVFDTRNAINTKALIDTHRLLKYTLKDFNVHICLGNHDMYFENSYDICSIEILGELPNVNVYINGIEEIKFGDKNLYIVPWIINDKTDEFVSFIDKIKKNRKKNILFGHFEMIGVDMEGGNLSTFGLSPKLFSDGADLVISGHYHGKTHQKVDDSDIYYVGSPYPLTFANSDSIHGYWVLSSDDYRMDFVENPISPNFTTIFDTDDLDSIKSLKNKFVRFYINNSKSKEDIFKSRSLIDAKKPLFVQVIPYKDGSDESGKPNSQREANKLLNMDLFSLTEIYIDSNTDTLPTLKTIADIKLDIIKRVEVYKERLTFKK